MKRREETAEALALPEKKKAEDVEDARMKESASRVASNKEDRSARDSSR